MLADNCFAVIMAGGAGTRLWPLSSKDKPKHFLPLFAGKSLIEITMDRLEGLIPVERILILTSVKYREVARQTLPDIPDENFIYEPALRDTASAIGLAATVVQKRCSKATIIVQTADQLIEPIEQFREAVVGAADFLELNPDRLIAFGVEAVSPSTLVGWQKLGNKLDFPSCEVTEIAAFTEKPDLQTANQYMTEGCYCWNSGQFAWKADAILGEIDAHLPEASSILADIGAAWDTPDRERVLNELFPKMPKGSIDYKVMQCTQNACSILLSCSWEDMGTHESLLGRIGTASDGNRTFGKAVIAGHGNEVIGNTEQSVVVSASNLKIVVTDDTVFVGDADTDMKALVEKVQQVAPKIV